MSRHQYGTANPCSIHGKSLDCFEIVIVELQKLGKKALAPSAAEKKPQTSNSDNHGPVR